MATDLQQRFAKLLTDTATIKRAPVSTDTNLDLLLGDLQTVATGVACLWVPVKVTDDMLSVGPVSRNLQTVLFLPAADIQHHDELTDADGATWAVVDPPTLFRQRGTDHHWEALVERKVQ